MASKTAQHEPEKAEVIEELLDHCDTTLDRVKVLYEQFFLGIQKQPPSHLHTDVERKLRELQQIQIRNTAQRYRFATIQQKFGSYNSYWRRTLRQIENGTYHRNLAKIGRQAATTGEEIPDEILAAMPKRMREQVKRDREAAIMMQRRREQTVESGDFLEELDTPPVAARKTSDGAHVVDDTDGEFDLDAYFAAVTNEDAPAPKAPAPHVSRSTVPPPAGAGASGGWSGPSPAGANARIPRTPIFEGELPTEADFDPPTERSSAKPIPHPNPAVRAAVGMRVATPAAGMFVASSVTSAGAQPTTGAIPTQPSATATGAIRTQPIATQPGPTQPRPTQPGAIRTQPIATQPGPSATATGAIPTQPIATQPGPTQSGAIPTQPIPRAGLSGARPGLPAVPPPPGQSSPNRPAPSQVVRPLPVMPGAASVRPPVAVETLSGPFPREQQQAAAPGQAPRNPSGPQPAVPSGAGPPPPPPGRTQPIDRATQPIKPTRVTTQPGVAAPARVGPPPGMTDADVNALYAKYVKAKEAVGEKAGPGSYSKLLQTINAQAPKIMEQYKAKGVDFQVVVKDNQVVIRAKPKP